MKLSVHKTRSAVIVITGLIVLCSSWWWHYHGAVDAPTATRDPLAAYTPITWDTLMPAQQAGITLLQKNNRTTDFSQFKDSDPRAQAMLQEMRDQMEMARPVASMDGEKIRITGYLVPLEYDDTHQIKEFLLVPYFGACIHTPPPPPNQIIHVFLNVTPEGEFDTLDQVEIAGDIEVRSSDSDMGRSVYTVWADTLIKVATPATDSVR